MSYLMGIDLGTSGVKSMIIDYEGNVKALSRKEYGIDIPSEGYAEQQPEMWWKSTVLTIRRSLEESGINPRDIKGVGLSGQMHGMVLIDRSLGVVRPAIIWCDQRSREQVREIYDKIGKERLGRLTLSPVATGFQTASLLWIKENEPLSYKNTYKVILPKDYIRLKLAGKLETDFTDASSTLAFDTASFKWSEDIIGALGLDNEKYPVCKNPHDISGEVTGNVAEETGLLKGTPVVCGGGDQPMQAIGNGIVIPGVVSSTIGTGGQIFTPIGKPLYDKELRTHTFCNAIPGTWNIMGASLSAGLSLQWLRDNILSGMDYKTMDNEAGKLPPGSGGLIFLPYLIGERTPHMDPYASGVFFGLTLKTNRFNMARAVMEGVTFALRESIDIFNSLGIQMKTIIASGGGAKSSLWLGMQADIFGMEVRTSKITEHACMGAAITAGVGLSVYPGFESACRDIIRHDNKIFYPDARNSVIYDYYYNVYKSLYARNKDLYEEMSKNLQVLGISKEMKCKY